VSSFPSMPGETVGRAELEDAVKVRLLKGVFWWWLSAFFIACVSAPVADLDMWHEIALIRQSVAAGHLLTRDVFAYTPTVDPAVDHEWGAGAVLYLLTLGGASWPVVAFKYVLALATAAVVLKCARLRGASFEVLSLLAPLVMLVSGLGWATLRAHAYSFLFFAVLLWFLELDDRGKRTWIPFWLVMFVIWANIHGGCIMGLIALGLHWMEQVVRRRSHARLAGVIALTVAAMAINPFGLAYYRHMWNTLRMPRPEITEWWPMWQYSGLHTALFCVAAVIAVYAIAICGLRASRGVLLLAATAAGAVIHVRVLPFFILAWAAYVPAFVKQTPLGGLINRLFRRRELVTAGALVLAIAATVLLAHIEFWRLTVPEDSYPIGAVRYLAGQNFRGNAMTPFQAGAYVSWRLFPAVKVSIDSRYDIAYPRSVTEENFRFYRAEAGWQHTLIKYPTDVVLVPRATPLANKMPETAWTRVYVDRFFELYARPGLPLGFVDHSSHSFRDTFP
jgi:hypothetical protein